MLLKYMSLALLGLTSLSCAAPLGTVANVEAGEPIDPKVPCFGSDICERDVEVREVFPGTPCWKIGSCKREDWTDSFSNALADPSVTTTSAPTIMVLGSTEPIVPSVTTTSAPTLMVLGSPEPLMPATSTHRPGPANLTRSTTASDLDVLNTTHTLDTRYSWPAMNAQSCTCVQHKNGYNGRWTVKIGYPFQQSRCDSFREMLDSRNMPDWNYSCAESDNGDTQVQFSFHIHDNVWGDVMNVWLKAAWPMINEFNCPNKRDLIGIEVPASSVLDARDDVVDTTILTAAPLSQQSCTAEQETGDSLRYHIHLGMGWTVFEGALSDATEAALKSALGNAWGASYGSKSDDDGMSQFHFYTQSHGHGATINSALGGVFGDQINGFNCPSH